MLAFTFTLAFNSAKVVVPHAQFQADPNNIKPKSKAELNANVNVNANAKPIELGEVQVRQAKQSESVPLRDENNVKPKTLEELNQKGFFDDRDNRARVAKLHKLIDHLVNDYQKDFDILLDEMKTTKLKKYQTYPLVRLTTDELKKIISNYDFKKEERYINYLGITKVKDDLYTLQLDTFVDKLIKINLKEVPLEENVNVLFNMYDKNLDGKISKDEFNELMEYFSQINLLNYDPGTIQMISDRIFTLIDLNRKGYIVQEDLRVYLEKYKDQEITINPFVKIKTRDPVTKIRPSEQGLNNSVLDPEQLKELDRINRKKYRSKLDKYWFLNKKMIIWTGIYVVACIASGVINRQLEGNRIYATTQAARFFAGIIFLNLSFLMLFMCITTITWLATTPIRPYLPLGDTVFYHEVCGCVLGVAVVIHILIHLLGDYREVAAKCIVQPAKAYVTVSWLIFENITGMTGFLAMITFMFVILPAIIKYFREQNFEYFYYMHKAFYLGIILLCMHCNTPDTDRWPILFFLILPSALFIVELIFRVMRYINNKTSVARLKFLKSGVIILEIVKPYKFTYLCGQYINVNIPYLSKWEWHPFTIASSPDDDNVYFYIAPAGDWTKNLKSLEKKLGTQPVKPKVAPVAVPEVKLDEEVKGN